MQVPLAFEYVIESQSENHRLEQDQDFELAGKWPNKSESDNRDERSERKSLQRLGLGRSQSPIKSLLALIANLNALPHDAI